MHVKCVYKLYYNRKYLNMLYLFTDFNIKKRMFAPQEKAMKKNITLLTVFYFDY